MTVAKILSAGRDHCQRRLVKRSLSECAGIFLECADLAALWSLATCRQTASRRVATEKSGDESPHCKRTNFHSFFRGISLQRLDAVIVHGLVDRTIT